MIKSKELICKLLVLVIALSFSAFLSKKCESKDNNGSLDFEKIVKETVKDFNKGKSPQSSMGKFVKAEYKDCFCELTMIVNDEMTRFLDLETQTDPHFSALNIMTPIVNSLSDKYTMDEITKALKESKIGYRYVYLDKNGRIKKTVIVSNNHLIGTIPYIYAYPEDSYFSTEFFTNYITESMSILVPIRLDEYTVLKDVIATHNGPEYIYEVNGIEIDELSRDAISEVRQSVISEWQEDTRLIPFFKEMAKTGLVITYKFQNPEGVELFRYNITPKEILSNV